MGAYQDLAEAEGAMYMYCRTSGKSTQKAFMFMPYKKLAKLSLNRLRLSCISCKCMKLASKSAIESESSAKAGSRDSSGKTDEPDLGVKA